MDGASEPVRPELYVSIVESGPSGAAPAKSKVRAPLSGFLSESPLAVIQSLTILCANPVLKWRRFW